MGANPNKIITSFADTVGPQQRAYLESKWKNKLGALASVDKRYALEGKQMTNSKRLQLATVLENVDRELTRAYRMFEGTQVPDIGPFRFHVFDMITALYPTSIAEELVSVQALSQKIGQIFFLRYLYGSDKGKVRAGDDMLSPFTGAADYNKYDSEEVDDEFVGSSGDDEYETFLQWIPVRRGTLTITTGGEPLVDDGNGNLKQGSTIRGSIDYKTGKVEITLAANATEDLAASYIYDQEYAPTKTGQVNVRVDEAIITARPHKLSALWAFDAAYDLQASQGVSIEEAILEACTAELRHERDGLVMRALYNQAANTSTWSKEIPTALTQKEHYESFITEISRACTRITQDTKRATGNWVVLGKEGIDVLNAVGAPRFEGTGEIAPAGPHFAGTLDRRLKVYFNPFFAEDEYLVGYKGSLYLDSGYVIGDYLPIFASQLIMLEDFMGRRGFASMYGTKMINNRMYVKGTITS